MVIHDDGRPEIGSSEQALRNGDLRICPTRIDHSPVLFAHKVIANQCQDRQRGHYHKCFSCAWNNTWVRSHGLPPASVVERRSYVRTG